MLEVDAYIDPGGNPFRRPCPPIEGDPLRRILFTASVLAACALAPGVAAAQGLSAQGLGDSTIRVQALTLDHNFPVAGLATAVKGCGGGRATTVTTGDNGTALATVPLGCYQVTVTTVPGGCSLDGSPTARVTVLPGLPQQAIFHVRCA